MGDTKENKTLTIFKEQLTLHSSDHCNNLFLTRDGKETELKDISNEQLSRLFKILNSDVRYQNIDYKLKVYEELQKRDLRK
jgi:hypothetical protein